MLFWESMQSHFLFCLYFLLLKSYWNSVYFFSFSSQTQSKVFQFLPVSYREKMLMFVQFAADLFFLLRHAHFLISLLTLLNFWMWNPFHSFIAHFFMFQMAYWCQLFVHFDRSLHLNWIQFQHFDSFVFLLEVWNLLLFIQTQNEVDPAWTICEPWFWGARDQIPFRLNLHSFCRHY